MRQAQNRFIINEMKSSYAGKGFRQRQWWCPLLPSHSPPHSRWVPRRVTTISPPPLPLSASSGHCHWGPRWVVAVYPPCRRRVPPHRVAAIEGGWGWGAPPLPWVPPRSSSWTCGAPLVVVMAVGAPSLVPVGALEAMGVVPVIVVAV